MNIAFGKALNSLFVPKHMKLPFLITSGLFLQHLWCRKIFDKIFKMTKRVLCKSGTGDSLLVILENQMLLNFIYLEISEVLKSSVATQWLKVFWAHPDLFTSKVLSQKPCLRAT